MEAEEEGGRRGDVPGLRDRRGIPGTAERRHDQYSEPANHGE